MTLHPDWRRFDAPWTWPHFTPAELACRCEGRYCAGEYWHDPGFLDALEALRTAMNAPLKLHSAHRCALWNAHVGGAPLSQHKRIAADIALKGHDPAALYAAARGIGFTGFGFYETFLHVDHGPPREWHGPGKAVELWRVWLHNRASSDRSPA